MFPSQSGPDSPQGQRSDISSLKHVNSVFSADSRFSFLIKQGQSQLKQGNSVAAEVTIRNALILARLNFVPGHDNLTRALEDFAHCCNLNHKESLAESSYLELINLAEQFPEKFAGQGASSAISTPPNKFFHYEETLYLLVKRYANNGECLNSARTITKSY